jgi:hypothetical protein
MRNKVHWLCMLFMSVCIGLVGESIHSLSTMYALIQDMPHLYKHMNMHNMPCVHIARVCEYIDQQQKVPIDLVKLAVNEVIDFFVMMHDVRCAHGGEQTPIIVDCSAACADIIHNGCQPGPLRIGTLNATSFILATNGCSDRIVIDENGAVVVEMPTAGEALTVNGNILLMLREHKVF